VCDVVVVYWGRGRVGVLAVRWPTAGDRWGGGGGGHDAVLGVHITLMT
jgi:hypothetical protein